MASLLAQRSPLAAASEQLRLLTSLKNLKKFPGPLKPTRFEILQINVGKMCNQTCRHCHVDAGPDRKEIMTWETMQECLKALDKNVGFSTVDITGGAPEMNPFFRDFVKEIRSRSVKIIVRCNLTIILSNKKYYDLPEFFAQNNINVVSSLPFYDERATDRQRGKGVFTKSIEALKMLNSVGYGKAGSNLLLDLVYNPSGAFFSPPQSRLEIDFKNELKKKFDIEFNRLFAITNMPISRFLEYLIESGNFEEYMEKLVKAYNPAAAQNVMCRNTLSVGWDGQLYDCDFNQMLDLNLASAVKHISQFNQSLLDRNIVLNQHCYGCTAGAGSSCGGETT